VSSIATAAKARRLLHRILPDTHSDRRLMSRLGGKSPMAKSDVYIFTPCNLQVAADGAVVIDLCRSALSLITN
jgi:hypothetical protein